MTRNPKKIPEELSVAEAADYLGCSVRTVYRLIAEEQLPAYRLPRVNHKRHLKRSDLDTYLASWQEAVR